jgi:hypothetical protein
MHVSFTFFQIFGIHLIIKKIKKLLKIKLSPQKYIFKNSSIVFMKLDVFIILQIYVIM